MSPMSPMSPIDAFWRWFAGEAARFTKLTRGGRVGAVVDEVCDRLHEIDADLWCEIGSAKAPESLELVITAHGNGALFSDVRDLVTAAPTIDGWIVTALKPPQGWKFTTQNDGIRVDVARTYFGPLQSSDDPDMLAVRIYCTEYSVDQQRHFDYAAGNIVETVAGEELAAAVGYIDAGPLPSPVPSSGYLPIEELHAYIVWALKKKRPQS